MVTRKEAENIALKLAGVNPKEIVLMTKFTPVPYGDKLLENETFIYDKNKILWRYNKEEGIWHTGAEQFIRTNLRNQLFGDEQQKKNYVDEIVSYVKDITYDDKFEPDSNPFLIALKNKVYDIKNDIFLDYKPEFYITSKIPHDVNEEIKECPIIDKFFEDSIGEEYKATLYDLAAYMMFRGYPYQKLFFVVGQGKTGKSQYLKLLEKLIGSDNFCSVEPKNIQKDKHSMAQMWLKLANIVSDIDYNALENINIIKKLTGGDTVEIRKMYRDPFSATLYAKQIFSTNKLPVVKEKTSAWYRRVYLVEFSNVVTKEKEDKFILQKMIQEEEMQGFVFQCLKKLREMYLDNFNFTYDIDIDKMAGMYEELSNPILSFMKQNCSFDGSDYCVRWEFIDRFNVWLRNNNLPPESKSEVESFLKERYNEVRRINEQTEQYNRCWSGFSWLNTGQKTLKYTTYTSYTNQIKKVYIYREEVSNHGNSGISGILQKKGEKKQ